MWRKVLDITIGIQIPTCIEISDISCHHSAIIWCSTYKYKFFCTKVKGFSHCSELYSSVELCILGCHIACSLTAQVEEVGIITVLKKEVQQQNQFRGSLQEVIPEDLKEYTNATLIEHIFISQRIQNKFSHWTQHYCLKVFSSKVG